MVSEISVYNRTLTANRIDQTKAHKQTHEIKQPKEKRTAPERTRQPHTHADAENEIAAKNPVPGLETHIMVVMRCAHHVHTREHATRRGYCGV